MSFTKQRIGRGLAVASWLAIAFLTLRPMPVVEGAPASPWCLACGPGWAADAVANVLLFVPLGAALVLAGLPLRRTLIAVALTTLAIELLQWRTVSGRDASLADLITNGTGGLIGAVVFARPALVLRPSRARALALALGWCALWLLGTAITARALSPSLPDALWWAHWQLPSPLPGDTDPAIAQVRAVSLAGVPLERGPVQNWRAYRAPMLVGGAVTADAVLPPAERAPDAKILVIDVADSEAELFSFRRRDDGVTFYVRTRAVALHLRSPSVWSGPFLAAAGPDTVHLRGSLTDGRLVVDARGTAGSVHRALALSPNWGWTFLLPFEALGRWFRLFTMLWIAALVLPIAYWGVQAAHGARPLVRLLAAATVLAPLAGLGIVPVLAGLPPVHWTELAAWLIGSVGGLALGRRHSPVAALVQAFA